jgi:aminoglycoside phosphotransferase (APT) family kinase protein
MIIGKMQLDEVEVDISLVGRLLAAEFPQWADLPIEPFHSAGTNNPIFRLGDDMAVRLPRIPNATGQVDKDHQFGTVRRYGSTETYHLLTCWLKEAGSVPLSTSGVWAWAIPHVTYK